MNTWPIESTRFPYLQMHIRSGEQSLTVEVLIDTAFDGDVALLPNMVTTTTPADLFQRWRLADGTRIRTPAYYAAVTIGSVRFTNAIVTTVGDKPLIGRNLLRHFVVTLDHGRRVLVEP